jgi:hypothetical protein
MRHNLFLLALLLPRVAGAQEPTPTTQPSTLEDEFARSLAAEAPPAPTPPVRSANLLNPEISVIGTMAGSWSDSGEPPPSAGDDPTHRGISLQELELSFAADVDPYFKMRTFLALPNLGELEVEESFLETTALPANLMFKAGTLRSNVGRNNEQHLHVQDFARRPLVTQLLGEDGLRGPGAQLSVLLPFPWFFTVYTELFTLSGDDRERLSGTVVLEQFAPLSDSLSLLVGLSGATLFRGEDPEAEPESPRREFLLGGDVYFKWKPSNVATTYAWIAFSAEYFARKLKDESAFTGAGYAQLVAQVARRWRAGLRFDAHAEAGELFDPQERIVSASLTFLPSELSRVRLTALRDDASDSTQHTVLVQLEGTIGAHAAHAF